MAGELSISLNINGAAASPGVWRQNFQQQFTADCASADHSPTVTVGTSEEDLLVGDLAGVEGFLCLTNLDATNFVEWGPKSGGAMVALGKLMPLQSAVLQLKPGVTLRWAANTAACKVKAILYRT